MTETIVRMTSAGGIDYRPAVALRPPRAATPNNNDLGDSRPAPPLGVPGDAVATTAAGGRVDSGSGPPRAPPTGTAAAEGSDASVRRGDARSTAAIEGEGRPTALEAADEPADERMPPPTGDADTAVVAISLPVGDVIVSVGCEDRGQRQ
jgi:hypothetical protein